MSTTLCLPKTLRKPVLSTASLTSATISGTQWTTKMAASGLTSTSIAAPTRSGKTPSSSPAGVAWPSSPMRCAGTARSGWMWHAGWTYSLKTPHPSATLPTGHTASSIWKSSTDHRSTATSERRPVRWTLYTLRLLTWMPIRKLASTKQILPCRGLVAQRETIFCKQTI